MITNVPTTSASTHINVAIETVKSLLDTATGALVIARYMIHGKPRQIPISNIFEPSALATAISPRPCFATINELNKSGTEVPAANTVKPIITSLTHNPLASATPDLTNTQLKNTIQAIDIQKIYHVLDSTLAIDGYVI